MIGAELTTNFFERLRIGVAHKLMTSSWPQMDAALEYSAFNLDRRLWSRRLIRGGLS